MRDVVQTLWIGESLSAMERMCIASFLDHGHPLHLYAYAPIDGVPNGVTLRDANEILPASMIWQYTESPSYAGFANHFRYELLHRRGGWWADTDVICLRPFHSEREHVVANEKHRDTTHATNCVLKAPAGSNLMRYAADECASKDTTTLWWGDTGPHLLVAALKKLGMEDCLASPSDFCGIDCVQWESLLAPDPPALNGGMGLHLWNEMWRRNGKDKNARYAPTSLYETFRARFGC